MKHTFLLDPKPDDWQDLKCTTCRIVVGGYPSEALALIEDSFEQTDCNGGAIAINEQYCEKIMNLQSKKNRYK